ncbi:Smr/MutS family protein [Desulfatirhabdium butyrativorans]|uniref:Smr/MutS family protein n=1 Tax=Desulfatirhabdium butyrativorans TaxID=340467 RepID=UPI0006848B1B|nr:Smr/MutS family protein [Desulfatirhabdium butyrativorans]
MKRHTHPDNGFHRPFADLKKRFQAPASEGHPEAVLKKPERLDTCPDDFELFRQTMCDVTPLPGRGKYRMAKSEHPAATPRQTPDADGFAKLHRLVLTGEGFDVSLTPEYIEGTASDISRHIPRSLYRGRFSIQAHLDLHGYTAREARIRFDAFLETCLRDSLRIVLIIHGRGLSSPGEPVLKRCVQEWIVRSSWRKWVSAYCSARSCDGGSGATVLMLRNLQAHPKKRKRNSG